MLSIIIPTYNRNALLYYHVSSILQYPQKSLFEIIIVNDYKSSKIEKEATWGDQIRIYDNPKSGVASARNFGASKAKYDWLLFLDDDMLMTPENLEVYLKHCNEDIKKTVNLDWNYSVETLIQLNQSAFGRFLIHHRFTSLKGWCGLDDWTKPIQVLEGLTSQNLLIHRTIFYFVGEYNETFPFAGAEDFEFAKRTLNADIISYVDSTSVMIHNELDRLTPTNWYLRKFRDGVTKRIAYDLGYQQQFIPFSFKFSIPFIIKPLNQLILTLTSKLRNFDSLNFKLYSFWLGQEIHRGFYSKKHFK